MALDEATKTFELVVPAETAGLRFSSSTGGMGGVGLTLTFSTTPAGLDQFFAASHLPTPTEHSPGSKPQPLFAGMPACGLGDGFTYSAIVEQDTSVSSTARSLAVDHSDPAAPRVLLVASTL